MEDRKPNTLPSSCSGTTSGWALQILQQLNLLREVHCRTPFQEWYHLTYLEYAWHRVRSRASSTHLEENVMVPRQRNPGRSDSSVLGQWKCPRNGMEKTMARATWECMKSMHETSLVSPRTKLLVRRVFTGMIRGREICDLQRTPCVCSVRASTHGGHHGSCMGSREAVTFRQKGAQHHPAKEGGPGFFAFPSSQTLKGRTLRVKMWEHLRARLCPFLSFFLL